MKHYILFLFLCSSLLISPPLYSNVECLKHIEQVQNPRDREIPKDEEKQRGLDLLANEIIEGIDEIDIRKTARSSIFETTYGFRWKMVNLHTGKRIIIKVDKDFRLISARYSDNSKIMRP